MALSKEVERALAGVVQWLGEEGGREGCRQLVRALDARVATLSPSLIAKAFVTADIDAFAKSEGVTTRRDSDGAGQLLRRVRDAMNLPSWQRLVALATEWNAGESPEIDVARALQGPLFQCWSNSDDPAQLAALVANDARWRGDHRDHYAKAHEATLVVLDLVRDRSGYWESYIGIDATEAIDAAKTLATDRDEDQRERERELVERSITLLERVERSPDDWLPTGELSRALRLALELAQQPQPEAERVIAAIEALEFAEKRLRESTSYARTNRREDAKRRAELRKEWSDALRARARCPELERWIASDRARRS
ncbi:MAG: hypothetical protein JNK05_10745 [Myxococcales bacterium]|nr:hypothetical protein [Myxococcales bacterium]